MANNPISMDELDEVEFTADEERVQDLVGLVKDDLASREKWENKVNLMHRKRMGIRRAKSFPWPNASNINIPMVDKTIRRLKPGFVNLVFNTRPIASFDPVTGVDVERARKAELFFDWLIRTHIDGFFRSVVRNVDWMLEKGKAVIKTTWDYRTEDVNETVKFTEFGTEGMALLTAPPEEVPMEMKAAFIADKLNLDLDDQDDVDVVEEVLKAVLDGEESVDIFKEENEIVNKPKVTAIKPQDVIVPADTTDIRTARRITHRLFLTKDDLRQKEKDGIYKNVDQVQGSKALDLDNQLINSQEDREGVRAFNEEDEVAEIWETYSWQRLDGEDKPAVRTVITIDPNSMVELRSMKYHFEHGEWPFVDYNFEENDDRYYSSRGIVEMLDDIGTEINAQHNGKIDRMTIANAPMILIRTGSGVSGKNIRFIPGQTIRTQRPTEDVIPFQFPNIDASFQTEEIILKTWGEEYIGDPAFGLSGVNNAVGEAKTATEIDLIEQNANMIFSLDGSIFQDNMKRLYEQIWGLWMQYGPEEIWIKSAKSEPEKLTKAEIMGRYDIRPTGTSGTTNPVLEAQKSAVRFQSLVGNPLIRQRELIRDFLEKDDMRMADRLLKSEEELQAELEAEQAAQQSQEAPTVDEALGAAEQAKRNGARSLRAQ